MRTPNPILAACMAALALALVLAAAPAQGASRLVVRGAGFGHGVGMSQYGALGFAKRGSDHAAILRHYYTGTQVGRLSGLVTVRILLRTAPRARFRGIAGVAGGRRLEPGRTYTAVRVLGGNVALRSASGRVLGTYASPLVLVGAAGGVRVLGKAGNGVTNGRYRGDLELRAGSLGGISAINAVSLEDYIRGVVPGEVPASWPDAALRAQAVAARTYAIATSKNGEGFDQYADTRSQMYPGISGEHPRTDAAVAATAGQVVTYDSKPIVTYYFSTSGGRTENVENSFLGADPQPYLQSVADPYDGGPRHRWTLRMTVAKATSRLGSLVKGRLRQITVLQRGRSPRVMRAQVVGTGGRTSVTGPQLRAKLGLYDTWARFTVITANAARGDGNAPRSGSRGPGTGGSKPHSLLAGTAWVGAKRETQAERVIGAITGSIAPAVAGRWAAVERFDGGRWVQEFETLLEVAGRYRATVTRPGLWRVRYDGEPSPVVRVRG
jgi:stage II sporulation protein D